MASAVDTRSNNTRTAQVAPLARTATTTSGGATDATEPAPADSYEPATVRRAETMLKRAGFSPGTVDGSYTQMTESALKEFQSAMGLTADGRITGVTMQKLVAVNQRMDKARREQSGLIGRGQKHDNIEQVEKRLDRLGYDTGAVDGVFDGQTAEAVKAFKHDQREFGRSSDSGLIANNGRDVLAREVKEISHDPYRARVKPSDERRAADRRVATAAGAANADGTTGIGRGDHGLEVGVVQKHLRAAGYDPQRVDGVFDDRTEGMVKEFQRKSGLPASGRVDVATWSKLQRATMETRSPTAPRQSEGERSAAVKHTEKLLREVGAKPGKVDGIYTEATQQAVDRFRRKHHLKGVGQGVGRGTLMALERVARKMRDPIYGLPVSKATGYVNGNPRPLRVVRVEGELVEVDTARAYLRMQEAARKDGVNLDLISGFRTMSEQRYLYNGWVNRLPGFNPAAPPGYSNHQSGIALDLNTDGPSREVGSGAVYNWLAHHAGRYGFSRIPAEHWHWEYSGR